MAQETPIVKVELRDKLGTKYARRLRKNGRLPATVYGKENKPVSVSMDEKEILTHLHSGAGGGARTRAPPRWQRSALPLSYARS